MYTDGACSHYAFVCEALIAPYNLNPNPNPNPSPSPSPDPNPSPNPNPIANSNPDPDPNPNQALNAPAASTLAKYLQQATPVVPASAAVPLPAPLVCASLLPPDELRALAPEELARKLGEP